jgi:hypothetical protein
MTLVLKGVLVGDNRQHALQSLILELDHSAAPLANQVLVMRLGRHRLEALESLTEVMRPNQPALQEDVQSSIDRSGTHPLAFLAEPATNAIDREMIFGQQDSFGYQVALSGDRQPMISKETAETLKEGGPLTPIEVGHGRTLRTRWQAAPGRAGVRRRCASGLPAAVA